MVESSRIIIIIIIKIHGDIIGRRDLRHLSTAAIADFRQREKAGTG